MKTRFNKFPIFIIALLGSVAMMISSCKKSDPEPYVYADAQLRVVNTVSGSEAQDFYRNDTKVSTAAIAYGSSNANYYTVPGGSATFAFKNTGSTAATATATYTLDGGSATLFYYKTENGSSGIVGAPDDNTAPAAGKAKVRFVNFGLAADKLNIRFLVSGTPILSDLGRSFSNYYTIDPGLDIAVNVVGSATSVTVPASSFVAGKIYTVWFDPGATTGTVTSHVVVQN